MQQKSTITTAATEYAKRPKDERFASLSAMIGAAQYDKDHSAERTYNLRDLRAITSYPSPNPAFPTSTRPEHAATVALESPKGIAHFTHYSFGQLARTIGAPAAYLRALPPAIAADAINFGLQDSDPGTAANLLIRANGGTPVVRAATSDTYGRVWDAQLYQAVDRHFGDGQTSAGGSWQSPPTWDGEPAGQYRGDRDSFVIRVDGGSIVTDPRASGDGRLYRGVMIRNSEVGHCSVTIECVLFDYVCGNHNLWGAIIDRKYRRRHVGTRITRDTITELLQLARSFNQRSASQDEQIIKALVEHEIASSKEAVIDELRKVGYTKDQATDAYETCEAKDPSLNPRSWWGVSAGTTRNSQESGWQDDRWQLDTLAAQLLAKGARQLVTV